MNLLTHVIRALLDLFVDDRSLALQVLVIVGLAAASAHFLPAVPLAAGAILLLGCPGILLANIWLSRLG
ncbi:MAG TPA: hypothetical protein VK522_13230 [Pseudolabrys sp.]|nr:hypothetical protein [Pseudolabrys sp.]